MIVTGNKKYALYKTAQLIYAFEKMRGFESGSFEKTLYDLQRRVRELSNQEHGNFISSGGWTATRQLDADAEEASVYISFDIAEIQLDPKRYHYINDLSTVQEDWKYFETPEIPLEEQV